ncbi:hypothetical protein Rcae01_06541 [Novipirellula caenicola]|uniref:Uncharacterized protein n=1 Tax=Novipirellula caenicola TaxID=1536901 RepID=A0ABP9W512_9BACT
MASLLDLLLTRKVTAFDAHLVDRHFCFARARICCRRKSGRTSRCSNDSPPRDRTLSHGSPPSDRSRAADGCKRLARELANNDVLDGLGSPSNGKGCTMDFLVRRCCTMDFLVCRTTKSTARQDFRQHGIPPWKIEILHEFRSQASASDAFSHSAKSQVDRARTCKTFRLRSYRMRSQPK